jgi:hypothetical protein
MKNTFKNICLEEIISYICTRFQSEELIERVKRDRFPASG